MKYYFAICIFFCNPAVNLFALSCKLMNNPKIRSWIRMPIQITINHQNLAHSMLSHA